MLNDTSDHFPLFACFDLAVQNLNNFFKCTRRVSKNDCVIKFQNKLMNSDWSSLYTFGTVDEMYGSFFERLFKIDDECFPLLTRLRRTHLYLKV